MKPVAIALLVSTARIAVGQADRLRQVAELGPAGRENPVSAMSADGRLFAAATPNGTVVVWDTARGRRTASIRASPGALAFTPDNRLAIAAGSEMNVVDLATSRAHPVAGEWKNVSALAFSREAVAWASPQSATVRVRSLRDGAALRTFDGHTSSVQSIAFHPDGLELAAGEFFRIARLWSLRTSCAQQVFTNTSSELHALSFSSNGRRLAVTSDSSIQIADVISGREIKRYLPDSGAFLNAAFSADGALIAVTNDSGLKLWRSDPQPLAIAGAPNRPTLHILAIGVNAYRNPEWRLGFAEQDASDIAEFFEQHEDRLPYTPRSVRVLGSCATRTEMRSVLDDLARTAKPEDALLVFMAGHGKQVGQEFYYYPFEMRPAPDHELPALGFSASELGAALRKIEARRQVLLLDACQSGAAVAAIQKAVVRSMPAGRSVRILSAAANTEEAMEVEQLGHGILTSVLLKGLRAKLDSAQPESAGQLLQYAVREVPETASKYDKSGSQKPEFAGAGPDFTIMNAGGGARIAPAISSVRVTRTAPPHTGAPFACRPTAADKTFVRPEGVTELIGDLVFRCSGKLEVPSATLQLYFNTNITGKLRLDGTPEALLITEQPGTRTETAGVVLGKNAFRGRQNGSNMIRWEATPFPAAGGEADIQIRITGVRVNATQLAVAAARDLTQVVAFYSVEARGQPLLRQQQAVGYIAGASAPKFGECNGTGRTPIEFTSAEPQNAALANGASEQGKMQFGVRVQESFPDQYAPSASTLRQRALASGAPAPAGSADQGTRFIATLSNLPNGVAVYVTRGAERSVSSPQARAHLIRTDPNGSGPGEPASRDAIGVCGDQSLAMTRLPVEAGSAAAVWEVTSSDPLGIDTFVFGLMIAYDSKPDQATPGLGTSTIRFDYAPVSTATTASATAPVPRFSAVSPYRNFFYIQPPSTRLLFSGVTNQSGFDSGLAIENTSGRAGSCTLMYAGSTPAGSAPAPQTSQPVPAGAWLSLTLSAGGSHGIAATPGFRGCIQAVCLWKSARSSYGTWRMGSQPGELKPGVPFEPGIDPKAVSVECGFR